MTMHVSAEILEMLNPSSALWYSDGACPFLTLFTPEQNLQESHGFLLQIHILFV